MEGEMIKRYHLFAVLLLLFSYISGCGGSGSSSVDEPAHMKVSISEHPITSKEADVPVSIPMNLSCDADDLFDSTCKAQKAIISLNGYTNEVPLNISMKSGDSRSLNITVFSESDLLMPPFNYLSDQNPSNSVTEWSTYSEVVGETRTELIGKTTETCVTKEIPPANPCPEGETPKPDGCSDTPQTTTECTPDKVYNLTLPLYTSGTLKLMERTNVLEETSIGYLKGNGTGYIENGIAHITFNYAPPKDSDILAVFVASLKPLKHMPYGNDIKLTYGSLTLQQSGNFLVDKNGDSYASVDGNVISLIKPAGYKDSPMIVSYSGEPYQTTGGECAGWGDGINTQYRIKTKYAPVKPDTFKVFTTEQPGEVLSSNYSTGEFIVKFARPPLSTERIMVSYVLSQCDTTVGITIVTNDGNSYFEIPVEITK
jgi:hypothetical protein